MKKLTTRRIMFFCFTVVLMVCFASRATVCHAGIHLSLATPGVDPDNLQVGVPAIILVQLSGLGTGQELDTLAGTVTYNGALLGKPSVSSGSIVPSPLHDSQDFLPSEEFGMADATFMTFGTKSSDHISSDGIFFSFEVTPIAPGNGCASGFMLGWLRCVGC